MANEISKPTLIAIGVGVAALGLTAATVVASRRSPTAKALLKEGAKAYDRFRVALAETREDFEDVLAEAKAETEEIIQNAIHSREDSNNDEHSDATVTKMKDAMTKQTIGEVQKPERRKTENY